MKTIFKGNNYDVCKLTDSDAYQLGTDGRFAVLDRFYGKANSFNSVCEVFETDQQALAWVAEHDKHLISDTEDFTPDVDEIDDEDNDDFLDCDGECVGCERSCADRIPEAAGDK